MKLLIGVRNVEKMLQYFNKNVNFRYQGTIASIGIQKMSGPPVFKQIPLFLCACVFNMGSKAFDTIAFGYVMNDDAISYMDEIQAIYKSYQGIHEHPIASLSFPLIKRKKNDLYHALPEFLQKNVWYCQRPKKGEICNSCSSCKRMKEVLNG